MGNVSSRVEKQDFLPTTPGGLRGMRQPGGLLQKGRSKREVFGYFHGGKRDTRAEKKHQSSGGGFKGNHESDQEKQSPKWYFQDNQAADFSKTSLPEGGSFDKCQTRPSAFKAVSWKSFLCMPRLSSTKGQKLSKSNSSLTHSSTSSSSQRGPLHSHLLHTISLDESTNSIQSFPAYTPHFKPAPTQLSASVGHNNHTGGSLDRVSQGPPDILAVDKTPLSCESLSRLHSSWEPPPPNGPTYSPEDVVKQPEDQLTEKGMELHQLKRNLSENDDPFTEMYLRMNELDEPKQVDVAKLQPVMQQAQCSQQELKLQLSKAQQEEKWMQEELDLQQRQCEKLRLQQQHAEHLSPRLEETQWDVCQKTAGISLLKQQFRDAQEEMAQKKGEIFSLKTQLQEFRTELQAEDSQLAQLGKSFQTLPEHETPVPPRDFPMQACLDVLGCEADGSKSRGMQGKSAEGAEWLWGELLRVRRQAQLQEAKFEQEWKTWEEEKKKVLRYQREIQARYVEMYYRNQALERQLREVWHFQAEPRCIGSEPPWIEGAESSKI